nr:E3 ubiquitin-protein ligase listerin [Ipomoea batatas]
MTTKLKPAVLHRSLTCESANLAVLMVEEVAENVNDAIAHTSSSYNLEMTLEMLESTHYFASSTILDCLFEHIPLEFFAHTTVKKKDLELPASVSKAARAAKRAISSALFALEYCGSANAIRTSLLSFKIEV